MTELRRLLKSPGIGGLPPQPCPSASPRSIPHLPEGGLAGGARMKSSPRDRRIRRRLRLSRGDSRPSAAGSPDRLRHAGLWAAPTRPAFRTWTEQPRPRSHPPDPGRDGAPQRNPVGHGGSFAFGSTASRRRNDRPARSQDQPKAAARRQRLRASSFVIAAGANAGSKRRGHALAHRRGKSRARPLQPLRPPTMASAT